MGLDQRVVDLDKAGRARFRDHGAFEVITCTSGLGMVLGAEFLAVTGGDMTGFGTADRFVGFDGVAPRFRQTSKCYHADR
ncbi:MULTISPECIES: transposase [unclassified Streptomyces]|uniref:transposase n=1 Tax=unclassified Streptomyces TaxID=2593676 RepID=UPI0027422B52|nr:MULTISPECIES: transposase [unclassified Streptomyces]